MDSNISLLNGAEVREVTSTTNTTTTTINQASHLARYVYVRIIPPLRIIYY